MSDRRFRDLPVQFEEIRQDDQIDITQLPRREEEFQSEFRVVRTRKSAERARAGRPAAPLTQAAARRTRR
jgi:hypothetical protein